MKKFDKDKIWKVAKVSILALSVVLSIGFTEKKLSDKTCASIDVKIWESLEVRNPRILSDEFLTEEDILSIVTLKGREALVGVELIHIDSKEMELRLKSNKFVKDAEVVKDLKGNLVIRVSQEQPIARIVESDRSYYVAASGKILPLSNRHTARVLIVYGEQLDSLLAPGLRKEDGLLNLINYIHDDELRSAQFHSIEILDDQDVLLYTQVSDVVVEFGKCEQHVEKFEKVDLFYDQILPRKGWSYYDTINVDYKDQIICK